MKLAVEPCLFEYYVFLIKQQGSYHEDSISEVNTLWNDIAVEYGLQPGDNDLLKKINGLSSTIYLDKRVKVIDSQHTQDNSVWLKMDLAHDVIIITLLINSPAGTDTDEPWEFWHGSYLEARRYRLKLEHLFYYSTVLQTIVNDTSDRDGSDPAEFIAKKLVADFPPFKNTTVDSAVLPAGKLWRFGVNQRFMFTLTKDNEEKASMFLANDFSYIVSILGKIENHYLQAVSLYENLNQMERTAQDLEVQLPDILACEDTKMLQARKSEVDRLGKKAVEMLSSLRICGTNIEANLKNLNSAVPGHTGDDKDLFQNLIGIYAEYQENISSWSDVADNILMRINKYTEDTKTKLTEYIQHEKMKDSLKIMPETRKPYKTTAEEGDYGMARDQYQDEFKDEPLPAGERAVEWGSNYLFYEDDPENCFDLAAMLCRQGQNIMCITRQHPDKVKKSCEMEQAAVKLFWLSTTACEFCLPPTLTRISHEISKYLKEKGRGVVMLDGLEFLVNHNDFLQVLKFLDSVKETIVVNRSILLLTLSPHAFSPKELSLIRKNTDVIESRPAQYDLSRLDAK